MVAEETSLWAEGESVRARAADTQPVLPRTPRPTHSEAARLLTSQDVPCVPNGRSAATQRGERPRGLAGAGLPPWGHLRGLRTVTEGPQAVPLGSWFLPLHTVCLRHRSAAPRADTLDSPRLDAPAAGRRARPPGACAPTRVTSPRRAVPPQGGSEREKKEKTREKNKQWKTGEAGRHFLRG